MSETIFKTSGIVEYQEKEFQYSTTLYFGGDERHPDDIDIEPVNEEDQDLLDENMEEIEKKALNKAHEHYWNKSDKRSNHA